MAWTTPVTRAVGYLVTATNWNTDIVNNLLAIASVGSYKLVAEASTSTEHVLDGGWLECNGAAVSRSTYSALFTKLNALSLPFGSGDGSTTFNLPDLRGRVPVASGGASAVGASDGVTAANRTGTRHRHGAHGHPGSTNSNAGAHTPAGTLNSTGNHGGHAHFATSGYVNSGGTGDVSFDIAVADHTHTFTGTAVADHTHTPTIATADGGSGNASDPLDGPAYQVIGIWVIKF